MFSGVQLTCLRVPALRVARGARFLVLLAAALLLSGFAAAQRRDFPASYRITHVSDDEGGVKLTLTLTLHNYSGRDIEDCGITLSASDHRATPIGNFEPIRLLPSARELTVRHSFVVPKAEYERWQKGVAPALELLVPDGDGGTRIEKIDALRAVPEPEAADSPDI